MEDKSENFHWADYLTFGAFLVFSSLIGVFVRIKDRHKMNSTNFLTGGGDMHWTLVALSMQASFLSAIFVLSIPVEIYTSGTVYYYLAIAYVIAIPVSGYFYMSLFYRLKILSAYEYLEIRFNKTVRTFCAVTFCVQIILYLSVVLYTPALALAQVTDLSITLAVALCGLVCTFYTFLGGMKATIWNDFFQMIIIASSLVCVIVFGTLNVGGFSKVWQISKDGGRIDFNDFRFDPTIKTTFWTQVVGGSLITMSLYASNQTAIQKFNSVRTLTDAKKSIWMTTFSSCFFLTLVTILGLVAYANYWNCDPLKSGQISKPDQLIPHLVMEVMSHLPGLPGLFIAAAFSAALSSLSGSLTAMSAVILSDFIEPLSLAVKGSPLQEATRSILSKAFTLSLGLLVTGLGFVAQFFGDVVIQISFGIFGFVGCPLLSVITLGIFVPFVNGIGAVSGLLSSLIVTSWIAIGSTLAGIPRDTLPTSTEGCNLTISAYDAGNQSYQSGNSDVLAVYKISVMHYGVIAMIVSALVAIPVSLLTGRTKSIKANLIVDCYEECCCCCFSSSSSLHRYLLCGTHLEKEEDMQGHEGKDMTYDENVNPCYIFEKRREITLKVSFSEISFVHEIPFNVSPSSSSSSVASLPSTQDVDESLDGHSLATLEEEKF